MIKDEGGMVGWPDKLVMLVLCCHALHRVVAVRLKTLQAGEPPPAPRVRSITVLSRRQ